MSNKFSFFVDLWINNTASFRSTFLPIFDPVTSLLFAAKTCLVWLLARLGWSPPRPQRPQRPSREGYLNADTSLTSARESSPLEDAETSAQYHFRFTGKDGLAHPLLNLTNCHIHTQLRLDSIWRLIPYVKL